MLLCQLFTVLFINRYKRSDLTLQSLGVTHRVRCLRSLLSSLTCQSALGCVWTKCAVTQTHRRFAIGRFHPSPRPCWPAPLLKWHRGKAVRFKRWRSGQTWADAHQTQTQQAEHWRTIVGTTQTWKGITILAPRTASWMRLLRWRRRARMRMGKLSKVRLTESRDGQNSYNSSFNIYESCQKYWTGYWLRLPSILSPLRNMSSPLGSMSPTTSTQVQARKRRRGVSKVIIYYSIFIICCACTAKMT